MCYDAPRGPAEALPELRSCVQYFNLFRTHYAIRCFDHQLKIVKERLNDGNLMGIFTAHSVAGDIVKMLRFVDEALRKFQASFI